MLWFIEGGGYGGSVSRDLLVMRIDGGEGVEKYLERWMTAFGEIVII